MSLPKLRPGGSGANRLAAALRRLMPKNSPVSPQVDLVPGCAFGAVVDQRLKDMERHLSELKGRVNSLFYLVIGAVVVEVVMRLIK